MKESYRREGGDGRGVREEKGERAWTETGEKGVAVYFSSLGLGIGLCIRLYVLVNNA